MRGSPAPILRHYGGGAARSAWPAGPWPRGGGALSGSISPCTAPGIPALFGLVAPFRLFAQRGLELSQEPADAGTRRAGRLGRGAPPRPIVLAVSLDQAVRLAYPPPGRKRPQPINARVRGAAIAAR